MKNWYNNTQEDIYTVAIEVEGTAWTYFCWSLNYQEAVKTAHDQHVAEVGPLSSITRCLVWGKCNDDGCCGGQSHGAEFFISTDLGTGSMMN